MTGAREGIERGRSSIKIDNQELEQLTETVLPFGKYNSSFSLESWNWFDVDHQVDRFATSTFTHSYLHNPSAFGCRFNDQLYTTSMSQDKSYHPVPSFSYGATCSLLLCKRFVGDLICPNKSDVIFSLLFVSLLYL